MSSDFALQAFKQTLNLAKEANTTLFDAQSGGKLLRTAAGFSDSGEQKDPCLYVHVHPFSVLKCTHGCTLIIYSWLHLNKFLLLQQVLQ